MARQITSGDFWVHIGDGNSAQVVDSKEYISKKTGVKHIKLILLPSKRIEDMYDLSDIQDPKTGLCVMEYKWTDVIWLERGTTRSRAWILTDFMGGSTPASRRYEDVSTALNDTERLLKSAESAKNRAYAELNKEREQQLEALKQKTDMLREVARGRGRVESEQEYFEEGESGPPQG